MKLSKVKVSLLCLCLMSSFVLVNLGVKPGPWSASASGGAGGWEAPSPCTVWTDSFNAGPGAAYPIGWDLWSGINGSIDWNSTVYYSSPYSFHIRSPPPPDASCGWARPPLYTAVRPNSTGPLNSIDYSRDYKVELYFYLPTTQNHWLYVFMNRHIYSVIDYGTNFTARWGLSNHTIIALSTSKWYKITYRVDVSAQQYYVDVYDTKLAVNVVTNFTCNFHGEEFDWEPFVLGDDEVGPLNYGEAYWDDISVYFCQPASSYTVWSDHCDADPTANGWTCTVGGSGSFSNVSTQYYSSPYSYHMSSYGNSYAYALAPTYKMVSPDSNGSLNLIDYSESYTVELYFYLPTTNNHWISVFTNRHICTVIDDNTKFTARWNSSNYDIFHFNTATWYRITYRVVPPAHKYYVDIYDTMLRDYVVTHFVCNFTDAASWTEPFLLGDFENGTANFGEAYWDDITVHFSQLPSPCTVWSDHCNADPTANEWLCSVGGYGSFTNDNKQYYSSPYSYHMSSYGNSYAYALAPTYKMVSPDSNGSLSDVDYSRDYMVVLYFYLPATNNHWIAVFKNQHIDTIIDDYNIFTYTTFTPGWGLTNHHIIALENGTWYRITYRVDVSAQEYYLDIYDTKLGNYVITGLPCPFCGEAFGPHPFLLGDFENGTANWGEAYWDDIAVYYASQKINYKYLIIVPDNATWISALQPYIDWKTREGLQCYQYSSYPYPTPCEPIKVTNLTEITNAFGSVTAENIRKYIIDFWQSNIYASFLSYLFSTLRYVLLVGDVNYIPAYTYNYTWGSSWYHYAADQYYADFYQPNPIVVWPPGGHYINPCVDNTTWDAEVYVGRWPVNNITELNNVVNKTVTYEMYVNGVLQSPAGWQNRMLLLGAIMDNGELQPGDWTIAWKDGAYVDEVIKQNCANWWMGNVNATTLYDTNNNSTIWDSGHAYLNNLHNLTTSNIIDQINNVGFSAILTVCHGDYVSLQGRTCGSPGSWNPRFFYNDNVSSLRNNYTLPFWFTDCCLTGQFQNIWGDCLGEELLLADPATVGGVIAFIGCSDDSWYTYWLNTPNNNLNVTATLSDRLANLTFYELYDIGASLDYSYSKWGLGAALFEAKALYNATSWSTISYSPPDGMNMATCLGFNLLGEPSLQIWPEAPLGSPDYTISAPSQVLPGQNFTVTVNRTTTISGGFYPPYGPRKDAKVCLSMVQNGKVVYNVVKLTDSNGQANFTAPSQIGFLNLTVTDHPFLKPYLSQIACAQIGLASNVTMTDLTADQYSFNFTASGPAGQTGYINATLPVGLNQTAIKVFIDGVELVPPPFPVITTNGTHYFVYFEFTLSTHIITIRYAPTGTVDIATTNVTPAKTVAGQGCTVPINVTVQNQGSYEETFNVTLYTNTTSIDSQSVVLASGNSTTITFVWNTTSFARGNYTIKAMADTLPGETDVSDNTLTDGTVYVGIAGDVNADGKVDMKDISYVARRYGCKPGSSLWDPNADVTGSTAGVPDGKVDMKDISYVARRYGQHDP